MRQPGHRFGARHFLSFSVPGEPAPRLPPPARSRRSTRREHRGALRRRRDRRRIAAGTVARRLRSSQDLGRRRRRHGAAQRTAGVADLARRPRRRGRTARRFVVYVSRRGQPRIGAASARRPSSPSRRGHVGAELASPPAAVARRRALRRRRSGRTRCAQRRRVGPLGPDARVRRRPAGASCVAAPPSVAVRVAGGVRDGGAIVAFGVRRPTGARGRSTRPTLRARCRAPSRGDARRVAVAAPRRRSPAIGAGGRVGVAYNDGAGARRARLAGLSDRRAAGTLRAGEALPRHHLRVPDERARLRAHEGHARVARVRARRRSARTPT